MTFIDNASDLNFEIKEKKKHVILSDQSKNTLVNELLRVNINNKIQDEKKNNRDDVVTRCVIDTHLSNIDDLVQENKMLRETVEKYKKMYYDLHNNICNLHEKVNKCI